MEPLGHNFDGGRPDEEAAGLPPTLAGRYALVSAITPGAASVVWRARELSTGASVALKIFSSHLVRSPVDLSVAQHVVSANHQLRHPALVAASEIVLDGRHAAIVAPWLEGRSLRQVLEAGNRGFLDVDELRCWMGPLLDVLEEAHAHGVVHGALSPEVVMEHRGEVRVIGMGINAWLRRAAYGRGPAPVNDDGLPYLSPTQRHRVSPHVKDDIYAVGVMIYELLAGMFPRSRWWRHHQLPTTMAWQRRMHGGRGAAIPRAWERAIRRCLEPRERNRLGSIHELRTRLQLDATVPMRVAPASPPVRKVVPVPAPAPVRVPLAAPPPASPAMPAVAPAFAAPPPVADATPPPAFAAVAPSAPPERAPETTPATVPIAPLPFAPAAAVAPPPVPVQPPAAPPPQVYVPPSEDVAFPVRVAVAARTQVRSSEPNPTLVAEAIPERKVDPSAWPPPQFPPPVSRPPARDGHHVPAPARSMPVAPAAAVSQRPRTYEKAPATPGTMLLHALFVIVSLVTIAVGGWLAWQTYQRHLPPPATPGETRVASANTAEEPDVAAEEPGKNEPGMEAPDPQLNRAVEPAVVLPEKLAPPVEQTPAERAPMERASVEQEPSEQTPAEQTPMEEAPVAQAPVAVVVPEFGAIEVRSTPPEAEVRLAGAAPQRAPLHVDQLAPGTYAVEVSLPGHEPYVTVVNVVAGEMAQVDARLERLIGSLDVASDPGGVAFTVRSLDDGGPAREGVTPGKLRLPTGRYVVNFRRDGAARSSIVEVNTGRSALARATFPVAPVAATDTTPPRRVEEPERAPQVVASPSTAPNGQTPSSRVPEITSPEREGSSPPPANAIPSVVTAPPVSSPPINTVSPVPAPPKSPVNHAEPPAAELPIINRIDAREKLPPPPGAVPARIPEPVLSAAHGPPLEGGIFELGNVEVAPRLIERVDPVVPRRRFRGSEPARVELVVVIDRMGRVASAAVHSTTDESLVGPCLRAVRLWRFRPASEQGKAVPVRVAVPLVFQTL